VSLPKLLVSLRAKSINGLGISAKSLISKSKLKKWIKRIVLKAKIVKKEECFEKNASDTRNKQ
jgi:hypothetical protein